MRLAFFRLWGGGDLKSGRVPVVESDGTGLGGLGYSCDGDRIGDAGSSVWCFACMCLVRPDLLRKCRRQWGHGHGWVDGGPRVRIF
jgi:hypothetical protein